MLVDLHEHRVLGIDDLHDRRLGARQLPHSVRQDANEHVSDAACYPIT